jgi:hypothetical protein
MSRFVKIIIAGLVAFVLVVTAVVMLFAGSLNRVAANEWGCLYGGGLFESRGLKKTIAPGRSGGFTLADNLVAMPADDRIYAIDQDPATADFGGNPIIAPAKGTQADSAGIVQVDVPVQARFTINENACELYQNYLKKYRADGLEFNGTNDPENPGGWATFLNLQFNQTLIATIRPQVSQYTYIQLYNDFGLYADIQSKTSIELSRQLRTSLGGDFFCGPSYVFDGSADGKLEGSGCPPIEIIIKQIKPTEPQFIANLETIVENQEALRVIQSDKDRALATTQTEKEKSLAQTEADKERALAQTEADKEKAIAQAEADREIELAQVAKEREVQQAELEKQQLIAEATTALVTTETNNEVIKVQAETEFCRTLTDLGVDCAEYFKAINWRPSIILGDGVDTNLLIDATPDAPTATTPDETTDSAP